MTPQKVGWGAMLSYVCASAFSRSASRLESARSLLYIHKWFFYMCSLTRASDLRISSTNPWKQSLLGFSLQISFSTTVSNSHMPHPTYPLPKGNSSLRRPRPGSRCLKTSKSDYQSNVSSTQVIVNHCQHMLLISDPLIYDRERRW
jgi:hypothetical protein